MPLWRMQDTFIRKEDIEGTYSDRIVREDSWEVENNNEKRGQEGVE